MPNGTDYSSPGAFNRDTHESTHTHTCHDQISCDMTMEDWIAKRKEPTEGRGEVTGEVSRRHETANEIVRWSIFKRKTNAPGR